MISTPTHTQTPSASTSKVASRPRPRPLHKNPKPQPPLTPPKVSTPSPVHIIIDDSEDSDLTPLTSPVDSKINPILITTPSAKSIGGHGPSAPDGALKQQPSVDLDTWDISNLGTYVWVLVDRRSRVLEPEDHDDIEARSKDRFWWPGKIQSPSCMARPLKVKLFGDICHPPGGRTIEISNPGVWSGQPNILSCKEDDRMRFKNLTVVNLACNKDGVLGSPRKKVKHDWESLKEFWNSAVDELHAHYASLKPEVQTDEDDDLPAVGTMDFDIFVKSAPSPTRSAKGITTRGVANGKRKRADDLQSDAEEEVWKPSVLDPDGFEPGDTVFARAKPSPSIFWPARIEVYLPPKKPRQKGKYRVEYLDTTKDDIPRDWFYTPEENQFFTCTLGEWKSDYQDVQDDVDDGHDRARIRSPSPIPNDPPPNSAEFSELSIREQFAYVKPILSAILGELYPPARTRHSDFVAGAKKRKKVAENAALRGRMDPSDVTALQEYLSEWCLRDERRAQMIMDKEDGSEPTSPACDNDEFHTAGASRPASPTGTEMTLPLSQGDVPPDSSFASASELGDLEPTPPGVSSYSDTLPPLPRKRGCKAYEGLSPIERVEYCLNVLLPEAILQVLLWRTGKRTSVALLSEEEEERLHGEGQQLLQERDWVRDMMRLRNLGAPKKSAEGESEEVVFSTTGRAQRRVAAAPKSYRE
ncbi:hypothetical protein H0H81_004008 [Sphagnurus paluster]|uniref:PWWP domain-containing protein n=1 Tax=Sphagnurus paluster TaxID=117069 RepID=A0A9P7GHL2_9AGAR|nr:hypothetical protein H0H81_004008 [Sphagnurus paluster]